MSLLAQLVIAACIFAAGAAGGIKWHAGQDAIAEIAANKVRTDDAKKQIRVIDKASGDHASALAKINIQLGNAREKIASLSGRECFGDDTAGVLNTIGTEPGPAATGQPAGTATTIAAGSGLRYSTDRDAAGYIGLCRARYAEVASQLNQILDIEDARQLKAEKAK